MWWTQTALTILVTIFYSFQRPYHDCGLNYHIWLLTSRCDLPHRHQFCLCTGYHCLNIPVSLLEYSDIPMSFTGSKRKCLLFYPSRPPFIVPIVLLMRFRSRSHPEPARWWLSTPPKFQGTRSGYKGRGKDGGRAVSTLSQKKNS